LISLKEKAIRLVPEGHLHKPTLLTNLGNSLLSCFDRLGDPAYIERLILLLDQALRLTPHDDPDRPRLMYNLGNSLTGRFQHMGNVLDIDKAVLMFEEVVSLTPDGRVEKPDYLNNPGHALFYRFRRLGDRADIDKSISLKKKAIQLIPDGHLAKPTLLNSLALSSLGRFEHFDDAADVDKSILMFEQAVQRSTHYLHRYSTSWQPRPAPPLCLTIVGHVRPALRPLCPIFIRDGCSLHTHDDSVREVGGWWGWGRGDASARVEKVTAAAHAHQRVTFNPELTTSQPKSELPSKPKRRVSLGVVVNAETGEVIESGAGTVGATGKWHSQRRHTVMNTSAIVNRIKDAEEKRVRGGRS
jgi:hypothetical protein